jgi:plastocyanin
MIMQCRFAWPRLATGWLVAVPLLVALASVSLAADTVDISQKNRRFTPDAVEVKAGTVLHIMNDDNVTHHIFVDEPGMHFDSGEQPIGTTVDVPFDHPGTFDVQCAIHPTMQLTVKVK